ncbi:MAG TPA: ABC transporter ATP-binding protein [bacterium]|jgi:NitT/TauT family transport system ATP-binding protein|nr:ABC transporter ATP-binding protein [bacterium]
MTSGRSAVSVVLNQLRKTYANSHSPLIALDDVALEVAAGEFVSIVGPSGCGKSTLLMLIAGLLPPTQGTIAIDGRAIVGPYTDVGFVFQRDVLLEWRTVLQNVLLPAEIKHHPKAASRERALHLLEQVGLAGFERRYPYELSGGMRQRVALCRALIHEPPLLLMDEPFGALDALTREAMGFYLLRLWQDRQKTVIFVTHSIEEAVVLADRVVVMSPRPGRIVQTFTPDLPRPRTQMVKGSAHFHEVVDAIRELFRARGFLIEQPSAGARV